MTTTIKIPAKIAALQVGQLHDRLEALTGARPTSRNKPYLQRLLVKKLAEQPRAPRRDRVQEVIDGVNSGRLRPEPLPPASTPARPRRGAATAKPQDPRLPPIGQKISREYEGRTYTVTVLTGGLFSYASETYKSLSTIAKVITGTIWNGYLFFRLQPYPVRNKHAE